MPRSALSGTEIEEGKGSRVTISLEAGTSRELNITAQEADELASKGRDVSPWYVHLGRKISRPGAWLLGIAVTSLLIPAITKQWTDRPRELQLRTSLIDQLGESAARTVNTARFIVADTLPEATLRAQVCAKVEEDPQLSDRCAELEQDESRAEQTAHIETKTAWLQQGAVLESQLAAYFPGTELSREGKRYVDAVRIYLFLASGVCGDKRDEANTKLLRYLREDPADPEWGALYEMSEAECEQKSANLAFRELYGPLGDRMLAKRLDLLLFLNEADAAGFSVGLADFIVDALPALILLAVAALYVVGYAWALRRRLVRPASRRAAR